MAERSPLFLGLARPPKYLGLPVGYLVVLATGVVLPFIWTKSMVFFLIGIVAYPILWFVADREPHFFEVLRVSYGSVRATKNRALHGAAGRDAADIRRGPAIHPQVHRCDRSARASRGEAGDYGVLSAGVVRRSDTAGVEQNNVLRLRMAAARERCCSLCIRQ